MKMLVCIIGTFTVISMTESAQAVNLTGRYRCIQNCAVGSIGESGYVKQSEWSLNVWSQTGASSRAWVDWFSPYRMWLENWNEGAVYSVDGMIIRFDRGTIWQRDLRQPVTLRRRAGACRSQRVEGRRSSSDCIKRIIENAFPTNTCEATAFGLRRGPIHDPWAVGAARSLNGCAATSFIPESAL